MSRKFQYLTTDLLSDVIVVEGENKGSNVPRGHRFWYQWGVKDAEDAEQIAFVNENRDNKLDYPDSYQRPSTSEVFRDESTRTQVTQQNYELIPVEELKLVKLEELKKTRIEAIELGFIYKGHRIISDRDANGDVMVIQTQYDKGKIPSTFIYSYKVGPAEYVVLDVESKGVTTADGAVGFTHFSDAMMHYVNQECFGKEQAVALHIASLTTAQAIADFDISEHYDPDYNSDYAEH